MHNESKQLSVFIRTYKQIAIYLDSCMGDGTEGARGALAPPIFSGQTDKIHLELCLFSWPIKVVHPLILAPCAAPAMYYTSRMYCNKEILSTRAHTDTYNRHATLHTPMFPNRVIFKHNSRYNTRWLSQCSALGIGFSDKVIMCLQGFWL